MSGIEHEPRVCDMDRTTGANNRFSSSPGGASWSFLFRCPECGREGRFNTNYLGQRAVVCNGEKFDRRPMDLKLAVAEHDRSQSERERRLEEALKDLVAFVSVMCGSGEEAVIPETVATPLGVQVKIGAMMRDARSALNQEGGSNVG